MFKSLTNEYKEKIRELFRETIVITTTDIFNIEKYKNLEEFNHSSILMSLRNINKLLAE